VSLISRALIRVGVVTLIAGFAAMMCAGPGAIVLPFTAMLAQPLICPDGSTLTRTETPGTDSDGGRVTYIDLNCVDREGIRQAANLRSFLVLGGIYFVFFFILVLGVSLFVRQPAIGSPARPLSVEGIRQVQDLMAQNRKLEAIKLVRELTGADLATAKAHVETIVAPPPRPGPAMPAYMPKGPGLSQTEAMEELRRLRAQLDAGQITEREFHTRASEIAMRLSGG
jgi:hypothetical protein